MGAVTATGGQVRTQALIDREPSARERLVSLVMSAAISVVYLGIAHHRGALGVARNDDWAFLRVAHRFGQDGIFELNGWSQMTLVGQVVIVAPIVRLFGSAIAPLQVTVAALAALGLWAGYLTIRMTLSRGWSAVAIACLALGPMYASLSVSFMTDVPAFSFQMLALAAGARALRTTIPSLGWFTVSLGLSLVAFSIREFGVIAGLSVVIVAVARAETMRTKSFRLIVLVTLAWAVLVLTVFAWRSGLANSTPTAIRISPASVSADVRRMILAVLTLSVFMAPVVFALSPLKLVRALRGSMSVRWLLVAVVSALVAVRAGVGGTIWLGNYFGPSGSYSVTVGGPAPEILPGWAWAVLAVVAVISAMSIVMVGSISSERRRRARTGGTIDGLRRFMASRRSLIVVFTTLTIVISLAVQATTTAPYFDRYLISLLPFCAALIIMAALRNDLLSRWHHWGAGLGLAGLALVGLVFSDASAAFDGTRWRVAQSVADQGVAPAAIDGGFEWFGFHQDDPVDRRAAPPGRNFWIGLFSDRNVCVTSVRSLMPFEDTAESDLIVLERETVRSILVPDYEILATAGPDACDG